MSDHIVKAYDDDLAALKSMLSQMGGLAEDQLALSIDALVRRDTKLADRVVQADEKIDAMEIAVEEKAVLTIAKRQPMAKDLRNIMVAIRIASDIERIGDLAKNIAKRSHALYDNIPQRLTKGLAPYGFHALLSDIESELDPGSRRNRGAGAPDGLVLRRRLAEHREACDARQNGRDQRPGREADRAALRGPGADRRPAVRVGDEREASDERNTAEHPEQHHAVDAPAHVDRGDGGADEAAEQLQCEEQEPVGERARVRPEHGEDRAVQPPAAAGHLDRG